MTTLTYDDLGRLLTVSVNYGAFTKGHSYTYDLDGRRATYTNPEGTLYTYSYTPNGDFQSLSIPGEGAIAVTGYKWRAPSQMMFPGGTVINMVTDGLLRPTATSLLDPGGNAKASRVYTYNDENHITGIATEEGMHTYTLDELYRLTAAAFEIETQLQNEAYSYDGVGNRTSENGSAAWQYNDNHQLTSRPAVAYAYDDNGHTTSKTQNGVTTVYEYDVTERMTVVRIDGGAELGRYSYDPFGRRMSKTVNGVTTYFYYDDTGLLAEYTSTGQLISEYQYKPGSTWMTNPLFKRDGASGKVHYYYNSHLGQPLKLFDKSGKVTWAARSQAFGATSVFVNEVENNLRFPGQYEDGETGLFYNQQRYYDSSSGKYLSRDPIGNRGGLNNYLYALGAPVSYIDPTGEAAQVVAAAIGAAVGAIIGGGVNLLFQLSDKCSDGVDWTDVGLAAGAGALTGGAAVGIASFGASAAAAGATFAVASGAIAGFQSVASDMLHGRSINWGAAAWSVGLGTLAGGALGTGLAGTGMKFFPRSSPGSTDSSWARNASLINWGDVMKKVASPQAFFEGSLGGFFGGAPKGDEGAGSAGGAGSGTGCGCNG